MKFLCDQCKAKYQIADEKVQGKTLRMKCRKCGHVIEIKALPGAGPSSMPPAGTPGLSGVGATMQLDSLSEEQAQAALAAPKAPFARNSGPGAKPASPPRPGAGSPAAAPRPAAGARAPLAGANLAKPAAKPATPDEDEAPNSVLANAFAKSVQKTPGVTMAQASSPNDPPAEEWYVAIDEVPVGPIRHTELRAKYGTGHVTDDSLVWREGFEEWRPLRTLPELHALVREDMSQRASLLPSTPSKPTPRPPTTSTPGRTSAATPRPATSAATPGPARPSGPSGNVIPFQRQQGVAARKLEEPEDDEVTRISSSPLFPPAPTPAAEPAEGAPAAMAKAGISASSVGSPKIVDEDPFASAPSSPVFPPAAASAPISMVGASGTAGTHHDSVIMRLSQKTGVSKGIVALIAAAVFLLGVVVAVVLVRAKTAPPEVQEKIVEKQVVVTNTVFVPSSAPPTVATADPAASASTKVPGKPVAGGTTTATTVAAASTTTSTAKKWGPGGDEPEVPTDNGGNNGGGNVGALDGKAVGEVAQRNAVGVRKACYEKWVETGPADAKVQVHIRPDGTVSSVDKLSGSPPQFLDCVARIAMNWKFPKSSAGGTYPIPFIFN